MKHGLAWFRRWRVVCTVATVTLLSACVDTAEKKDDRAFLERVQSRAESAPAASEAGNIPGTTEAADSIPMIEVATNYLDMGIVPASGLSYDSVKVRNAGKADLVISDVKTTCGCTQGRIADNTLGPGEETDLKIAVDPNRIFGFESVKTLTLFSNDPNQSTVEVKVRAALEPEFVLEPPELDFETLEKGDVVTKTAIVRQNTKDPVIVLDAAAHGVVADWLDVALEERPPAAWQTPGMREYAIQVTVTPKAPVGPLAARLMLKLDHRRVKSYYLPVKANVTAFYSLTPPVGNFGPAIAGSTVENVLRIVADEPFEVVSAKADRPFITLHPHAEPTEHSIGIDVTVGENAPSGTFQGNAEIVVEGKERRYTEHVRLVGVVQPTQPAAAVAPAAQELRPVSPAPAQPVVGDQG